LRRLSTDYLDVHGASFDNDPPPLFIYNPPFISQRFDRKEIIMAKPVPITRNEQGRQILEDSRLNKSTAFTQEERDQYGLNGLLPPAIETIDLQVQRALLQIGKKPNSLEQYIYLTHLLDNNETLFYKLLSTDPARFLPIVYDPTVGQACLEFGHIFRSPRGMYVSIEDKGRVKQILGNWPVQDVRFICVSTGGRILGLGDLGTNGMGIPIGKLQLYTACAAVPPQYLLPLLLDCGTDNERLRKDPLYLGLRSPRPSTEELDEFVQEFVDAVREVFPKCCIHFEDWKGTDAIRLLARYTDKISCYNDDIQGTGSVTVAGLISALKLTGGNLSNQRVLFFGAGSAGIGIANMIVSAMKIEGLSEKEAQERIWMFDVNGLLEPSRKDLSPEQRKYSHKHEPSKDLVKCIESIKPTVLIGVSTVGKTFTERVVKAMTKLNDRPIIFALSNPTDRAECTAEEAYKWSNGKAIYAAGVQFDPVKLDGKTYLPGQANNFYVFPAIGLAVFATEAARVPDELFIEAARATADQVDEAQHKQGMLFPPQKDILKTEVQTAERVAAKIFDLGLARVERPANIRSWMQGMLYNPTY
jgi:malate dehydrogenase (oxaloacetate-decarboxylating)(NADP+)